MTKIKFGEMLTELRKKIEKKEIENLPSYVFEGEVIVVEDPEQVEPIAEHLKLQRLLGFDTETRPAFHKGEVHRVSLLQLATDHEVYLFRLNKCGFRPALRKLLGDPQIVKIGVGIRDDIRNLQKLEKFCPEAFIDMQTYAEKFGIEDKSFSKLMAIIFGVRISKRQQTSNWEVQELTEAQIRYAATDAWGALKMYQRLSAGV